MDKNRYSGLKIAMFGACGTGKTTLATALANELNLPCVTNHARTIIASLDIEDVRNVDSTTMALLEHALFLVRIKEQLKHSTSGFVSDRTPLDQVIYWYLECDKVYPKLTSNFVDSATEYLKFNPYDLFIYVPVEFELESSDTLRYFDEHRHAEDSIASKLYTEVKFNGEFSRHFITVSGSVEKHMQTILNYLETNL